MTEAREGLGEEDLTTDLEGEGITVLTVATVALTEVVEIIALIEVVVTETIEEEAGLEEVEEGLPWKGGDVVAMEENRRPEEEDKFRNSGKN